VSPWFKEVWSLGLTTTGVHGVSQICIPNEAKHKAGPAGRLHSCKSVKSVAKGSKD